ncbi:histidine phosphatase family protein [Candidatus Marsarchaeota archaeon]|jgi:broad specificity phosphatase PhoE|nr:histidine phosphatase family protein [Candidatus Marsarchaeota archaeon]
MKVILARHGNTEANNAGVHQSPDTPLSKEGALQSMALAKKLNGVAIDLIISSPYARAMQTAEIIGRELKKPIKYDDSLAEIIKPNGFPGKRSDDPELEKIIKEMEKHEKNTEWRYPGSENLKDFMVRVAGFVKRLEGMDYGTVLIITHSAVIKTIITVCMLGPEVDMGNYARILEFLHTKNTGVSELRYDNSGWGLMAYNDLSHL